MLAETAFAGLSLLQVALVSLALLIITMNVWSGWQSGVVRQVLRIVAIIVSYVAGVKLGPVMATLVPDVAVLGSAQTPIISILTGFLCYVVLRFVINMLFRKTREQESFIMRTIYGIGGATIGLFFSLIFLIATLVGIRLVGTVSDAQFRVAEKRHEPLPDNIRTGIMTQFSQARQAIENGPAAPVIMTIDPTPNDIYKTLDRVATMTADPDAMTRFVSYPGTKQLMEHPSLKKLAEDPEIQAKLQKKNLFDLLEDPKVLALINDTSLRDKLKTFEYKKAMDFALQPGPTIPTARKATPILTRTY